MFMKGYQEPAGSIRKGAWSPEEDSKLAEIVTRFGPGRWNFLAQVAGLQRTGKSCRLRWLNYLRPNVRHGGFTLEEQLLILQLHLRWGNRWARIAEQLPGRTDNDIKNYWRTRILKHAKHLNCDVDSPLFKHAISHIWIPTLLDRMKSGAGIGFRSGSESSMGETHLPVHSPEVSSVPQNSIILKPRGGLDERCSERPNIEGGSVGLWAPDNWPMGFNQAQITPDSSGFGPDYGPVILGSSPSAGSACEPELDWDFETCWIGKDYDDESPEKMLSASGDDMLYLQQQIFDVA